MSRENKFGRMGRRRMLKTLSGLGVGAGALAHLTDDALAEMSVDLDEEVPRLKGFRHTNHDEIAEGQPPEREPVYYTIPREKWVRVEASKDARRQINDRLDDVFQQVGREFDGIERITGDAGFANLTGDSTHNTVVVDVNRVTVTEDGVSPEAVRRRIEELLPAATDAVAGRGTERAETVEDVPVQVQLVEESLQAYYDYEYRPVPAGCQYEREGGGTCTVGTPVYDNTNDEYALVTAAHCLEGESQGESEVWQADTSSNHVGNRDGDQWRQDDPDVYGWDSFDACVVDLYSWYDVEHKFAADRGDDTYSSREIWGTKTKTALEDLADQDDYDTIPKRGRTTGYEAGSIYWAGDYTFKTEADSDGGDSGGPHYDTENFNGDPVAWMAGIHRSGTDTYGRAVYMEVIENEFDVTV